MVIYFLLKIKIFFRDMEIKLKNTNLKAHFQKRMMQNQHRIHQQSID